MIPLDPCATEDGTNCFWDATQHGNGYGKSFFEYDGITVLMYVPKGYHVESVQVEPDHFFEPGYAGGFGYGVTFVQPDPTPTPASTPEQTHTAETTTTPAEPFDLLAGTGLNLAPFGIIIAAAVAVALIGLSLIGWHQWKTKKEN